MNLSLTQHLSRNMKLAYPVIIGQVGHMMVNVADTIMVGRIGVIPLAAATFALTFYNILMVSGIGLSSAITPLVAAADEKDKSKLSSYLVNGFVLNMIAGLGLVAVGIFCCFFLDYFGQEQEVATLSAPYLMVMSVSLFPLMHFQTFRRYAEGLSDTLNPMLVSIGTNVINVFLNYLFIYGHWGFPEMGLIGAGYATLIARVLAGVWMHLATIHKGSLDFSLINRATLLRLRNIGVPSGLQYLFELGAFGAAAIMAGWISAEAQAAHQIAMNMAAITYMIALGLGTAGTIRIGNQVGLKNRRDLKLAGHSLMGMVVLFMGICGVVFVLFRKALVGLYIDVGEVSLYATALLVIAAAFQVSDGMQAVGLGILRGLPDVKIPTLVTLVAYWLVSIPAGYLFGFHMNMGVYGIWYGLVLGLTVAGIFHFFRFQYLISRLPF